MMFCALLFLMASLEANYKERLPSANREQEVVKTFQLHLKKNVFREPAVNVSFCSATDFD